MALETLIYPGSSSFFPGQTPFGIYDNDYEFQEDAPKVALWCARRLGYPIQNIELIDENFYACFEESVSEYGAQVNQFNIRNNLDTLWAAVSESGKRIEIVKVFQEPTPAINRFFDPYSVSGQGTLNLIDEFGFGSYSPAAQFVLMPMFEDLLRIQAIEFNDQFRKSAFTFNIVNGKIRVFPMPTSQNVNLYGKLYFDYYVKDEFTENSTTVTPNVISDYSDIPYNFMEYSGINDVGKQWIRKYTLALVKELLGAVREKYSQIPIPGSEVSLDGAALRSEAQTEKEALMTQLRETLEELSRKIQFENRNNEANQHQEMLRKVPLAIYIG